MGLKLFALTLCLVLSGCAGGSLKPTDVSRDQAAKPQRVQEGTVITAYTVTIKGNTEAAQATGAALGAYAANRATKNNSDVAQVLATAGGAVIGSVAGNTVSDLTLDRKGVNIVIKLDTGSVISVTQQVDANAVFNAGDSVYIINSGNQIKVLPKR